MQKRTLPALLLAFLLLLPGCGGEQAQDGVRLTVLASTYPVYLAAQAVTEGVDGVAVERLNTGEVSCLHDYTLTVNDMKKIQRAGVIAINGVELEEFMEDALAASEAPVIDCSQGVSLLESAGHVHEEGDGHDHGHFDPHYWMDPENMVQAVENLQDGLARLDPDRAEQYRENGQSAVLLLNVWDGALQDLLSDAEQGGVEVGGLVTFHDGFQYFAHAFGLPLLASIEEEEGSEASAREIVEITALVKEHRLPAIFTEVNGSDATANAISRETGCAVAQLTMLMDGPAEGGLANYYDGMADNLAAVLNSFSPSDQPDKEAAAAP